LQNGQDESRALAGAGLGATDQVAVLEQMGDGLGLDGCRGGVAFFGYCPPEFRQQGRKYAGGCGRGRKGGDVSGLVFFIRPASMPGGRIFFMDVHDNSLV
jgi:hypothetical protein